jgi:6-pyruvoyltetrahydropterin/6-carboxytetrahydropterin synthase
MFELSVEDYFAAAHQLRNYNGKCERLHGHNWKVQVTVTAERLNEIGLAMDFADIKRIMREAIDTLEHSLLNDIFPFTELNPSSENIARWLYETIKKKINTDGTIVTSVTVWESDTASATYYE